MTALGAALGTAGLLALSGCAPSPAPIAPVSASPTADAPAFASDAEALEAARTSFTEYQALSTQIGHEGGVSPERMSAVATGEALADEIRSFQGLVEGGLRGIGDLKFDSLTLQSADLASGNVTTYLCLDTSQADLVDKSGASAVTPDVARRYPLEVRFTLANQSPRLLVQESATWSGTNFC